MLAPMPAARPIVFLSDFGLGNEWVGLCHSVMSGIAPHCPIVDLSHLVRPLEVASGAILLADSMPYVHENAVVLAVVDPNVGRDREVAIETVSGRHLVGPDNGLLSLAAAAAPPVRVYHLKEGRFFPSPRSATFHGRDVFAPVAAALATGTRPHELGPEIADAHHLEVPEPRREAGTIRGQVIYVDHFGNLITNVSQSLLANFPAEPASISIRGVRVAGISPSYAAVPPGQPVAVVNSWNHVEIAVRDGSAATDLGARVGDEVVIA
jgi:S-adenosylmethionine hydrolase